MKNVELPVDTMKGLNKIGVHISMDDFGTGYLSLSRLKNFPICKLKIDRSFVCDIPSNPDNCTIAKATITLGHSMGLKVIAEGVETREQLDFLDEHSCDEAQGYYFSPPLHEDEFQRFLLNQKPARGMS
jgi:EAL domain-containing protein (putative c-di-GMP-specific phosphodiesterase class I)